MTESEITTLQEKIEIMRNNFLTFQDKYALTETDIQDIKNEEDQIIGVRFVCVINPTIQFVYVPSQVDELGVFVFPGDDAAISVQIVAQMTKQVNFLRQVPLMPVTVLGVIAPIFGERTIDFTQNSDEVYRIWGEVMTARVNNGKSEEAQTEDLGTTPGNVG